MNLYQLRDCDVEVLINSEGKQVEQLMSDYMLYVVRH